MQRIGDNYSVKKGCLLMKKIMSTVLCVSLLLLVLASCKEETTGAQTSSDLVSNASEVTFNSSEQSSETDESDAVSSEGSIDAAFEQFGVDIRHLFMDGEIEGVIPENLPEYEDGCIELYRHDKVDGTPENRQRRRCFYRTVAEILFYIPEIRTLNNTRTPYPESLNVEDYWAIEYYGDDSYVFVDTTVEPEEMALVSAIKYFNIPRDVMEAALEEYKINHWSEFNNEEDIHTEYGELPNLDIVYTLDNDIINEYYRYA